MADTTDSGRDEDDALNRQADAEASGVDFVPAPATDYYTRIGFAVAGGVALVAFVAVLQPGGLGIFEFGTSMVMIGLSLIILFAGLMAALFILRSTLRAIDARAGYLAAMSLRKAIAKDRVYASAEAMHQAQTGLDDLSQFGARQAEAVAALKASTKDHASMLARLSKDLAAMGSHDEQEWQALRAGIDQQAKQVERLTADAQRTNGQLDRLQRAFKTIQAQEASAMARLEGEGRQHADEIQRVAAGVADQAERIQRIPDELARLEAATEASSEKIHALANDLAKSDAHWSELVARLDDEEVKHRQAIEAMATAGDQRAAEHAHEHAAFAQQHADQHAESAAEHEATLRRQADSLKQVVADVAALEPRQMELSDRIEAAEQHQADAMAELQQRVAADVLAVDARALDAVEAVAKKTADRAATERKQREQALAAFSAQVAAARKQRQAEATAFEGRIDALQAALSDAEKALAAEAQARKASLARVSGRVTHLGTREAATEKHLQAEAKRQETAHKALAQEVSAMETAHQGVLRSLRTRATSQRKKLEMLTRDEKAFERRLQQEAAARQEGMTALKAEEARIAARLSKDEKAFDARHRRAAASMKEQRASLQQEIQRLAVEEGRLNRRLAAGASARRRAVQALKEQEERIEGRVAANEKALQHAVGRLESERVRLDKITRRILAEERQRRKEFEALAGEEIRLMSRVLRRNEGSSPEEEQPYWMDRAKAADNGPFGRVYRVAQVQGINAATARKLRKLGIRDTQDLWHADTGFVADYLRIDHEAVDLWQEEAELMAINGIGGPTAEALAAAGVTSVQKLGSEDPKHLVRIVTNASNGGNGANGVRVTVKNAEKWIKAARRYEPKP